MDLLKIDEGLFKTKDGVYTVKYGISCKPNPDLEGIAVKYAIYHVYDQDGIYVGQARDTDKDLDRAIREAKTKAVVKDGK